MLTVIAATAIGRSCSAGNKEDVKSASSSRGIFDNRTRHPHGNHRSKCVGISTNVRKYEMTVLSFWVCDTVIITLNM